MPEPLTSLEFSGPVIITHADFKPRESLAARRYDGQMAVCALLPPRFEADGKGPAIRASFRGISRWRAVTVPQAADPLWVGTP